MERMEQLKAMLSLCLIFGMAFCLGSVVGHTVRVRDQAVSYTHLTLPTKLVV